MSLFCLSKPVTLSFIISYCCLAMLIPMSPVSTIRSAWVKSILPFQCCWHREVRLQAPNAGKLQRWHQNRTRGQVWVKSWVEVRWANRRSTFWVDFASRVCRGGEADSAMPVSKWRRWRERRGFLQIVSPTLLQLVLRLPPSIIISMYMRLNYIRIDSARMCRQDQLEFRSEYITKELLGMSTFL